MFVWEGKIDEKLKELMYKYKNEFGCFPDTYEEIAYELMSYDQFVDLIEECLKKHLEIPYIVY